MQCKVHRSMVASIIGIKTDSHYKFIKKNMMKFAKKARFYLNFRMGKSLELNCVGFIAGVNGKIGNIESHAKMTCKIKGVKNLDVEVIRKTIAHNNVKAHSLVVATKPENVKKVAKLLHGNLCARLPKNAAKCLWNTYKTYSNP